MGPLDVYLCVTTISRLFIKCDMSTRSERADVILATKGAQFRMLTRRLVSVPSQYVAGKAYHVTLANGAAVRGSCPDWRYRHPADGCKHMIAAGRYVLKL